jgi:hypothetical protein
MANYVVEIGDDEGHSFKVSVDLVTTLTGNSTGSWRSLDKGFIRYNSGAAKNQTADGGGLSDRDVVLLNRDGTWGVRFNFFHDWVGANDQGNGTILQPWILNFKAGPISWVLV